MGGHSAPPSRKHVCEKERVRVTSQWRYERGKSQERKRERAGERSSGKRKCQSKQGKWDKEKMEKESRGR